MFHVLIEILAMTNCPLFQALWKREANVAILLLIFGVISETVKHVVGFPVRNGPSDASGLKMHRRGIPTPVHAAGNDGAWRRQPRRR